MENSDKNISHQQPPTTVKEVGIHLIYMSQGMAEIKKTLSDMANSYATNEDLSRAIGDRHKDQDVICKEVSELTSRVAVLESFNSRVLVSIAKWTIGAICIMLLAYTGYEQFIK